MRDKHEDVIALVESERLERDSVLASDIAAAEAVVQAAEAGDAGAPFEPQALQALRALIGSKYPEWARLRVRLKKAGVGVTALDAMLRGAPVDGGEGGGPGAADRLIELARATCTLVRDAQRAPYAIFQSASGARCVYGVESTAFSDWLSHAYYCEFDRAPPEAAVRVALATLRGQALFDGETEDIHLRIARQDGVYWLDLCNDEWQCIRIDESGWHVMAGDGVPLFTRTPSMAPLPIPTPGGSLDELWPLVNIPPELRLIMLAWLLECLRPETPFPVMELVGEQGSAKSSTQRVLRRLVDPNLSDLRSAPKSVEDIWVSARNAHLVSLENLSHLAPQYQDALCVLATGGGYSTRTYYTNAEETILKLKKPVVLNGISVVVTAQDLVDRSVHIELPVIERREMASVIESRFDAAHGRLLGALLDLFVSALIELKTVEVPPEKLPRMADFAMLGEAVARVYGKPAGMFLDGYHRARRDGVARTIDASPVGSALREYLSTHQSYQGTLSELLRNLERYRTSAEGWPRSPKGLGDALRRLAPALRQVGFECKSLPKTGGEIRWRIEPTGHAGCSGHENEQPAAGKKVAPPAMADIDQGEVY